MVRIDLNPTKKKRKQELSPINNKRLSVILPQAAIALTSLFLYAYIDLKTNDLKQKKDQLLAEKDKLKATENMINKLKSEIVKQQKEKEELDARFKTLEYLVSSRKSLLTKLNSVILPTPNGLWLESVEISKDSVKIAGSALDSELIARYYQYLDIIHKNIAFNGTERKISGTNVVFYNFSLEIKDQPITQKEGT
jgi:type IV pilus assembly protein PilN